MPKKNEAPSLASLLSAAKLEDLNAYLQSEGEEVDFSAKVEAAEAIAAKLGAAPPDAVAEAKEVLKRDKRFVESMQQAAERELRSNRKFRQEMADEAKGELVISMRPLVAALIESATPLAEQCKNVLAAADEVRSQYRRFGPV